MKLANEYGIKSLENKRKYNDVSWLHNLLSSCIYCLEILIQITLNVFIVNTSSSHIFYIFTYRFKTIVNFLHQSECLHQIV